MNGPQDPANKTIRKLLTETGKCIELRQWDIARARARAAGREAEKIGDINGLSLAGTHLERFEDYSLSAHFLAVAGRLKVPSSLPEWDGSPLPGQTLQIVQRIRDIGSPIRLARFIPLAARKAGRCIVLANPRLVPLFRRSFPQVDVREEGEDIGKDLAEADIIASYETIWQHLASDGPTLVKQFTPLLPDPALVRDFRKKYSGDTRPLIGICWASTNTKKDLPGLADWAPMLRSLNVTYVSLQYGDVAADVAELRSLSGCDVVYDETVDSLSDLDMFGAQVAAMNAVVTISNTGAHVAGALGVPMIVLLDDKTHLLWPVQGSQTAWYPSAKLVRKGGREWAEVFAEVRREVDQRLSGADVA